jgi:amino acid transporter
MNRSKLLTFFQVVMINVIAVDSLRNLTFSAAYGFALIFFYLLATLMFFIPAGLVSAELGTGWPSRGGFYVWVREAFGLKYSLLTIWLNWLYNVIWFPTVMALMAATFAYLFDPELAHNKFFMATLVVVFFWLITIVNCFGMKVSGIFSTISSIVGTLIPMGILTYLGILWMIKGKPIQIQFSWSSFFPSAFDMKNAAYLTNILFGLIGLEMAGSHADEMLNPKKNFSKAIFVSIVIVLATTILSSLAIAIVVPHQELNLLAGTMQAFTNLVQDLNLTWLIPFLIFMIILGGLGGAAAWIIGPSKGMMVAARDGTLPPFLTRMSKEGVPINILLLQGVLVSLLSIFFVLMPTVASAFWILSNITAQLALVCYIFLFAAAIKLHYHRPHVIRHFKIPGGRIGIWLVSCTGIFSCVAVVLIGFIPPEHTDVGNLWIYECILGGGMLILAVIPFVLLKLKKKAQP